MALLTATCCELLSWYRGPSVTWLGELLLGAWPSPLYLCLCLLERKGSFRNINVNRAHGELDVSEHPGATWGSQEPSTEFSRAKSQLASYSWLGNTAWVGVFRSHFLVMVPVLKSCSSHGLCSASDTSWVFSLTREKFSYYLTKVCLSIHSQFSESPESLSSWLVFLSGSLQFECLLSLLLQSWGQIFLLKTVSFGKSEQKSCLCEGKRRAIQAFRGRVVRM